MSQITKITQTQSKRHNWAEVKSWNYKLKHLPDYQSLVTAEIVGDHGEVSTTNLARIYYIVSGSGEFEIGDQTISVTAGDVITIAPNTTYNYHALPGQTLKIVLFMELWDN